MIPKLIKKFFPVRVDTFEEFVEMLKEERCDLVEAKGTVKKPRIRTFSIGLVGTFEYFLILRSETMPGRPIILKEFLWSRYGSSYGLSDAGCRGKVVLKLFRTASINLDRIKERIPNIRASIVTSEGVFRKLKYRQSSEKYER